MANAGRDPMPRPQRLHDEIGLDSKY